MVTTFEQERSRAAVLRENTPLFEQRGKLLYIGGSAGKLQLLGLLLQYDWTILEIDSANAQTLDGEVVVGDVRNAYDLFEPKEFDTIIWWHGPEHVYHCEIKGILIDLATLCKGLIVLGAPYGYYPQDAYGENIHERHLSHLRPEDFYQWGYKSETVGEFEGGNESCLIGWNFG